MKKLLITEAIKELLTGEQSTFTFDIQELGLSQADVTARVSKLKLILVTYEGSVELSFITPGE